MKLSIGRILNFHGIKGEVKVGFSKGKDGHIKKLKRVWVDELELNVENVRFHKQFAIIKFKELNSIDDVLPLKGKNILEESENIKKDLEEDEFLIHDLVGLDVFNPEDDHIGTIQSVYDNGANDIIVIKTGDEKEAMVPFIKEFVPVVDIASKKIIIKPIEGMLE